ncbi:hypothetical protein DFH09DRAFT_1283278, partial [Mycena vulgaris]
MPPYLPLAPSPSSAEEREGDMDQAKMTRRERDRRLKLGRGDDEDAEEGQGGQGDSVRERIRIWVADDVGSGRCIRLWVVKCQRRLWFRPHTRGSSRSPQLLNVQPQNSCRAFRYAAEVACAFKLAVLAPFIAPTLSFLCLYSYACSLRPVHSVPLCAFSWLVAPRLWPSPRCICFCARAAREYSSLFPSSPLFAPRSPLHFSFLLHLSRDGLFYSVIWRELSYSAIWRDLFHFTRCIAKPGSSMRVNSNPQLYWERHHLAESIRIPLLSSPPFQFRRTRRKRRMVHTPTNSTSSDVRNILAPPASPRGQVRAIDPGSIRIQLLHSSSPQADWGTNFIRTGSPPSRGVARRLDSKIMMGTNPSAIDSVFSRTEWHENIAEPRPDSFQNT